MLKTNYKLLHTCTCKEVVAFLCHGCPGVPSPLQASEEYLKQARNVEKRWTKELQNERDLRQQLQENLETMANQIHGLENEAKWTAEGRPRISSQGSKENLPPSGASSEILSSLSPVSSSPNRVGEFGGEEGKKRVGEGEKRKGEGEESEEDEKFFLSFSDSLSRTPASSTRWRRLCLCAGRSFHPNHKCVSTSGAS